jgi:hypothetical protein
MIALLPFPVLRQENFELRILGNDYLGHFYKAEDYFSAE